MDRGNGTWGTGAGESVGLRVGLDDVPAEGEAVGYGRAEPQIGERPFPPIERFVWEAMATLFRSTRP